MLLRAFAKINLDLRILGRRGDGYHEVRTILQTIDWSDEIRIELADEFRFAASGAPSDVSNLVVCAVREFERRTGRTVRANITLTKQVPVGAGLGGGSADAAVTLLALDRLYRHPLSGSDMDACLAALGSDVPFFAIGGRAEGTGRGDQIVPLQDEPSGPLVVVYPGIPISTAEAYSWLTVSDKSNRIGGFGTGFVSGRSTEAPRNDFESAVFGHHPILDEIKTELLRRGAERAALSGSGSAVFGIFRDETAAAGAASHFATIGVARVARFVSRAEYMRRVFGS